MEEKNEKRVKGCLAGITFFLLFCLLMAMCFGGLAGITFFLLFCLLMAMCFGGSDSDQKENKETTNNELQKEWFYEKDIDLNTGDTVYSATLFGKGPFLSHYHSDVRPTALFTFKKEGDNLQASVLLSLGEFIKNDTIDIYFLTMKPSARYTYKLISSKEAVLNVPNPEALLKKVNMKNAFFLEIPIQKQMSKRTVFEFMYTENTLDKRFCE